MDVWQLSNIKLASIFKFQQLAWGIANSKQPFVWIVRPDVVKDGQAVLSEEFLEESKDKGMIVSWCAQEKVLGHPSVDTLWLELYDRNYMWWCA
ncbi:Glycosyltransferase, partial [Thalictrum thalictroides]